MRRGDWAGLWLGILALLVGSMVGAVMAKQPPPPPPTAAPGSCFSPLVHCNLGDDLVGYPGRDQGHVGILREEDRERAGRS